MKNRRDGDDLLEKPMPSSEDSEQAILGAIILDNLVINQCIGNLVPDDFHSPTNRRIYAAMLSLFEASKSIEPILIGEELKRDGALSSVGGVSAITNLALGMPHLANIEEYVSKVREKSVARATIRLAQRKINELLAEDNEVVAVLDDFEHQIFGLRQNDRTESYSDVRTLAQESYKRVAKMAESGETVTLGLPSGFKDLDELTSGYQKGNLIIKAGRPSMGKTAHALQCALNACEWDPNLVIAIFELEMPKSDIVDRIICQQAKVDLHRYRRGHLMSMDWERITQGINAIHGHILIDDTPRLSVMEIKARARKMRSEHGRLDMIIVDHLGQVKGSGRPDKRLELGEISKGFKAMAKEFDLPVIALTQLSRKPEARTGNKPMMSDIRESGEIEEDADLVELLYREEYYKETEDNRGIAEVIVAKNRNGPTHPGIKLSFLKQFTRFENYFGG